MKKSLIRTIALLIIISFISLSLPGCYGKFQLSRNLYKWNGQVGDKTANTVVMWIMVILPVYEIVGAVDFFILNTIEYWTGENPVNMSANESEIRVVNMDGVDYEITATQNRFDIRSMNEDKHISLVYHDESRSWFVQDDSGNITQIAQLDDVDQNLLHLIKPDGKLLDVDLSTNQLAAN